MFKKASKQQIVTSVITFLWIFAINIITPMITSAPAWPMFFVTIFFAVSGGNVKEIKSIILSGFVAICMLYLLNKILGVLSPVMGGTAALALLIFIVLALIIVGGNFFPLFLNNYTFGYLTIGTIDFSIIEERFVGWLLMFLIGGAIILGGVLAISILVGKAFSKTVASEAV